jgi:hypothetical protein
MKKFQLFKAAITMALVFGLTGCEQGPDEGPSGYAIIIGGFDNGSVVSNPSGRAAAGTLVTLTVAPETAYRLADNSLKVTYGANAALTLTGGGGEYAFVMPAADVRVAAEFVEDHLRITVKLTEDTAKGRTFILPVKSQIVLSEDEPLYIEWGDGVTETKTAAPTYYNGFTHIYTSTGEYTITLKGDCYTNDSDPSSGGKCAFGFSTYGQGYAAAANKAKLIKAAGTITTLTQKSTVPDNAYAYLFYGCENLSDVTELVFSETGAPGNAFLTNAFAGCVSLTSLPGNFLAGLSGPQGDSFLSYAFDGCSSLASLPADFLSGLSGQQGGYFLNYAFRGCAPLASLPDGFLSGLSGEQRERFLEYTFSGCAKLASLPGGFLSGLSGQQGNFFLSQAFSGCAGLASLPDGFLSGVSGVQGDNFLNSAFSRCAGLASLPDNFLSGVSGAQNKSFLQSAFSGCSALASLPDGFLSGVSGAQGGNAYYGFLQSAFNGCASLASLPAGFLSGVSGQQGNHFLESAFSGCALLASLPAGFLSGVSGVQGDNFLSYAFNNCYRLNYIDIFSDGSAVSGGGGFMQSAMSNVARDVPSKLTLRIHGTTMLSPLTDACGLADVNVLEIQVKPDLVQAYKDAAAWSVISDSKFAALH